MEPSIDVTERQPLCPLGSDFRVSFFEESVLSRYEQAILQVLERTGLRFTSPRALDILEERGAVVDRPSGVARFAPGLVMAAVSRAPRDFVLGSRDGQCDLDLASRETFNTTNGCGTEVVDGDARRRASTKADLAAITPARGLPRIGAVLVADRRRQRLRRDA